MDFCIVFSGTMKQFLLFRNVPVDSKFHLVVGITAIIGAIGGVYVLTRTTKLLSQIVDKRQRKELTDLCNVCFTELDLSDYKRSTKCYVCEKFICRGRKCSRWVPKEASWECELCSTTKESCAKTNEWLEKQVLTNIKNNCPSRIARSEVYIPISAQYDINDNESSPGFLSFETRSFAHSSTIPVEEKMRVRDYIENLLSTMIDGMPLDDVLVSKMSDDPNYLKLFHTFHSQLTTQIYELETYLYAFYRDLPLPDSDGELTGLSHVKIKQLIDAITRELKLTFKNGAVRSITPTGEQTTQTEIEANNNSPYFHSKKYQELLATAVLNKITDPQLAAENLTETEKLVRSSFRNSFRKPNGQVSNESSSLTDNLLSARSFTPDEVHSDLFTEPVYENLTGRESVIGYLKDHTIALPELESDEYPASGEEDEIEEEFDSLNSDNWLLRKKKFGHDVPSVGMLVPAPKEDIRALIGDKTADEISDLSDNESSEDDFNNDELVFSNHRIQSDSLISGKHTAGLIDHLIDGSSLISVTSLNEGDPELVDIKNNNVSNKAALNGFHDIEKPVINLENGKMPETPQALNTDIILPPPSGFADDGEPTSPGSIAEREYKKWTNAVDMPNNPYAPDALKKRLSGSSENFMDLPNISQEEKESVDHTDAPKLDTNDNDKEYERYSRDYYINLSKCASGRRSTSPSNKVNHRFDTDQFHYRTNPLWSWNTINRLNKNNPVRRTNSLRSVRSLQSNRLSVLSYDNDDDVESSRSWKLSSQVDIPNSILEQFEKQLLHKNFKRDSFRALSKTTKEFVMNPIFDKEVDNDSGIGH